MKVSISKNSLLIEPETEFETEYLEEFGSDNLKCFIKRGLTNSDIIGLKITKE